MLTTLYLDPESWDLTVDAFGNIAMASAPYACAQDAASACRLWLGEALYDTRRGIPYDQAILGKLPPASRLADWYQTEAQTVPDVAKAKAMLVFDKRALGGQIQLTLNNGETNAISI